MPHTPDHDDRHRHLDVVRLPRRRRGGRRAQLRPRRHGRPARLLQGARRRRPDDGGRARRARPAPPSPTPASGSTPRRPAPSSPTSPPTAPTPCRRSTSSPSPTRAARPSCPASSRSRSAPSVTPTASSPRPPTVTGWAGTTTTPTCTTAASGSSGPGTTPTSSPSGCPPSTALVDKLTAGATVADIGCGHGASTVLMAQAFPASRFVGLRLPRGLDRHRRRAGRRRPAWRTGSSSRWRRHPRSAAPATTW